RSVTIRDSMTSLLMKPTLVGRDTLHELDQPLKKLAYVSNHWGPLLLILVNVMLFSRFGIIDLQNRIKIAKDNA
ncbi:hypothetical protein, partial [Vibrio campbellii]